MVVTCPPPPLGRFTQDCARPRCVYRARSPAGERAHRLAIPSVDGAKLVRARSVFRLRESPSSRARSLRESSAHERTAAPSAEASKAYVHHASAGQSSVYERANRRPVRPGAAIRMVPGGGGAAGASRASPWKGNDARLEKWMTAAARDGDGRARRGDRPPGLAQRQGRPCTFGLGRGNAKQLDRLGIQNHAADASPHVKPNQARTADVVVYSNSQRHRVGD